MEINAIGYALIALTAVIIAKIYLDSDTFQLKCIVSTVDGNKYCVRERENMEAAADLLANVTKKMNALVDYMEKNYGDRDNVKRLIKNFDPQKISETLPTSEYTAYSENKGEKLAFCLTKQKKGHELIDEHTLTFVAIHEMAHVMNSSIGHNSEFWQNFKFLLVNAERAGLYKPSDYKKNSQEYCGMKITDNPYYDI